MGSMYLGFVSPLRPEPPRDHTAVFGVTGVRHVDDRRGFVCPLSKTLYLRTALITPMATPNITEITVAATTNRIVTGTASPSSVVTARPFSLEEPMSP